MNRDEFKKMATQLYNNGNWPEEIENDQEPFWIPEYRDGWQASVFLVTKVLPWVSQRDEFWEWCKMNLSKNPLCFMSDVENNIEWWGFNSEQDAVLFSLRWA